MCVVLSLVQLKAVLATNAAAGTTTTSSTLVVPGGCVIDDRKAKTTSQQGKTQLATDKAGLELVQPPSPMLPPADFAKAPASNEQATSEPQQNQGGGIPRKKLPSMKANKAASPRLPLLPSPAEFVKASPASDKAARKPAVISMLPLSFFFTLVGTFFTFVVMFAMSSC